jgi:hypothetical protein
MAVKSPEILEKIKQLVDYNPITGALTRKHSYAGRRTDNPPSSVTILVAGMIFRRTRLCWAMATGEFPKRVYVVDGDKLNCALSNLTLLAPRRGKRKTKVADGLLV